MKRIFVGQFMTDLKCGLVPFGKLG